MILFINNITPDRRQSKSLILSTNVDQISLETGDKWQSKTLIMAFFDPRSSVVNSVFDCRLSGVDIQRT